VKASWFSLFKSIAFSKAFFVLLAFALVILVAGGTAFAQDTGYISGTVTDKSGAAVAGADVTVTSASGNVTRSTTTNGDGAYTVPGLAGGTYHLTVSAKGFQKFTAQNVVLNVAEKARIDVQLTVGAITEEVVVTGESVAQVETTSSDLSGTVNGKQITELQLNGRNFVQLATIVPGVSNQTGQDEGTVGVYGNVQFSFNGGRTEYNNWELDGGDNMDNGSNATLNVYPSIDAIAEFKVLTSNYGAQYGRNASGTVEVETKSGTNAFHGDVYYFGRNDAMNALNFFDAKKSDPTQPVPKFKKHDFGYTLGGPVFIPNHYNSDKKKTFFFWSQEWRRDLVPGQVFHASVPTLAERAGDFTDVCMSAQFASDCPNVANFAAIPVDPNAAPLLAMVPEPTITDPGAALANCGGLACFNASPATATHWREELIRVDHNFTSKIRGTFRYIHDSWDTVTPTTLWADYSFPTVQTNFVGPGTSFVARLNAEITPTLLNEFVASYTGDHIFLKNEGSGVVSRSSAGLTTTGIFPNFDDKLPDITLTGNTYFNDFSEGQAYIPWNNANPTYTLRDNVTKLVGKHNLLFGAYAAIAQKNEQSSFGAVQGVLNFNASNSVVGTGNAFADLLLGNVDSYSQASLAPKYYFRYQIVEPYFQDDWRISKRLTLNLGLRVSLFGTYRDKYKQAFNFEPSLYQPNQVAFASDGSLIDPTTGEQLAINDPRVTNGVVQCGASGQKSGCVKGHLFNPGPRIGFAYDPWGDGKTAIRGGYGIFFEHGNGNEANVESLEATPPLVLVPSQPNIVGYTNIGSGGGAVLAFPLGFNTIDTKGVWPYVQQWNLNVQHEFPFHLISSIAYVGSKGTHLGRAFDINQVVPVSDSANPYKVGEPIGANDCSTFTTPSGVAVTGTAKTNLSIACGDDPNPVRPFPGYGSLPFIQYQANSSYNSLQVAVTRSLAPLTLSLAYTYSHSLDDSSDRFDSSYVNSYDLARARASSNFDQRHMLNFSYVYSLPFFKNASKALRMTLGDWQWAGIMSIQTGTPFNVTDSNFSDNAGVSSGTTPGTFVDIVGDPHSAAGSCAIVAAGPQLYSPCAFADPQGLTFGDAGRNILRNPRTTNFDMSLAKNFKFNESTGFQFRAEAFNVFNHTQWSGVSNDFTNTDFLHPNAAHRARTLQLGLKFLF
jgi:hypothetical protein